MASLNQIAYSYLDSVNKSHDIMLLERIKFSIKYWRATLIRRDFERNPQDHKVRQSLIINLIKVDKADSCVIDIGTKVLRTSIKIPSPISIKGSDPFLYFGHVEYDQSCHLPFSHVTPAELMSFKYRRFTGNQIVYRYVNGYGYIYGACMFDLARVEAAFENPEQVVESCISATGCITDDDEFPISMHMLETILKGLRTAELSVITNDHEVKIETA